MSQNDVIYIGIFINHIDGALENNNIQQHVTLKFKPSKNEIKMYEKMLGKHVPVTILGYGNDGKNEGLLVDIPDKIPYFGAEQKHITLSVSKTGKPVDTGKIKFNKEIPKKFKNKTIVGTIGFFTKERGLLFSKGFIKQETEKTNNILK